MRKYFVCMRILYKQGACRLRQRCLSRCQHEPIILLPWTPDINTQIWPNIFQDKPPPLSPRVLKSSRSKNLSSHWSGFPTRPAEQFSLLSLILEIAKLSASLRLGYISITVNRQVIRCASAPILDHFSQPGQNTAGSCSLTTSWIILSGRDD